MPGYFTREEAESLLPRNTPVVREVQRLRHAQRTHEEVVAADRAKVLGNGHMPPDELRRHQVDSATAERQIAQLIEVVSELGILVKDLDTGLVDFPALRDGHEIYLCWQLGEPHIAWWHETSTGFSGRQPLEDEG